jgi:hypothetical protein
MGAAMGRWTMQGLIIIRWRASKPGHEVEAMKLADEADALYTKLREEGRVAGHEWIANFTGVDGGMFVVRGDPQGLVALTGTPEFAEINLRGILHLENWHWDMAFAGATVDEVYPGWRQLVGA